MPQCDNRQWRDGFGGSLFEVNAGGYISIQYLVQMTTALQERYAEHIFNCEIADYGPTERGVFATADIKQDTLLFKLPIEHLYIGNHLELTTRLMTLDNDYTRSLPSNLTNFPVFWTPHEVATLNGSALESMIPSRKEKLLAEDEKRRSLFLFYRTMVGSRAFTIDKKNANKLALVPFADMLNHSNEPNTDWKIVDEHFVLKTTKDVGKGEQLWDSYGTKTNYESILFYGFVLENNLLNDVTYEIFEIPTSLRKNVNFDYFKENFEFELCGGYSRGTTEIFSFVRFLACENADQSECPQTLNGLKTSVISRENELMVCKVLLNGFKAIYNRKIKSLRFAEDSKVARFVGTEINVLLHWITTLEGAVSILSEKKQKAAKKKVDTYAPNDYYNAVVRKIVNAGKNYK